MNFEQASHIRNLNITQFIENSVYIDLVFLDITQNITSMSNISGIKRGENNLQR